jgi:hypothetical protein
MPRKATRTEPEPPPLVYRGLNVCDCCGGTLTPRETLAGICATCIATDTPRPKTRERRKATRPCPPVVASAGRPKPGA